MIIKVPIKIIEDIKQVLENKVLHKYEGIEFYLFENKDNSLSIYYKSNKDLAKKKHLEFKFKSASYRYKLHQDIDFAITNLMQRCDGINRKGTIDKSKKDGIIKGFPEKRCEAISQKMDMLLEIAQDKEEIAKSEKNIAEAKKRMLDKFDTPTR